MAMPTKLNKLTIIDVVTEFKFDIKKNIEDLFFEVYSKVKHQGYEYHKLPIMELPPGIRDRDEKFNNQAYYRLQKGNYIINIGPKVLSFAIKGYYPGWQTYKEFIVSHFDELENVMKDWQINQSSMRYIDFFPEDDIFDRLTVSMSLPSGLCDEEYSSESKIFVNDIKCRSGIGVKVQIANAELKLEGSKDAQFGTVIDIDAYINGQMNALEEVIEKLHSKTKTIFFGLLKNDLIQSLEPEFDEE